MGIVRADQILHDVGNRVSGYVNGRFRLVLPAQIIRRPACRREVHIRNNPCQLAVHLLREGGELVPGSEPCFHMAYPDLLQKRRVGGQEGGGGIAVHQDQVRLGFRQDRLQLLNNPHRQPRERLALLHNVQVVIRLDLKLVQHHVQHLPVLGRHTDHRIYFGIMLLQFQYQRNHLDGFRPGSEDGHDLYPLHGTIPFFLFHRAGRSFLSLWEELRLAKCLFLYVVFPIWFQTGGRLHRPGRERYSRGRSGGCRWRPHRYPHRDGLPVRHGCLQGKQSGSSS
ncbi:hypothetical protein D3C75_743200 [compost metagenome]